ncbi:hypothetical protein [Shewanella seohaensis]|uniref:hypothetical protein n=1 Tax=Shewanella seohaensis TaxID=755175 RepID=UPI0035B76151
MKLTDLSTNLGGIAAVIAIIAAVYGFYKWSFTRGQNSARQDAHWNRKNEAFTKLYSPLRASLLNTKFSIYTSTGYPTFKQRFINAINVFSSRKHLKGKIRGFISALSDKAQSTSVECETSFPQTKIKLTVEEYCQFADKELIDKIHEIEVMSSAPWDYSEDEIIEKQYHLAEFIYTKYDSLEHELHNKALQRTSR